MNTPNKQTEHQGNICCQGCYQIGIKEGKAQALAEVMKIIDELGCKGETHGFRHKWIDAEELKARLEKI